MATFTNEQTARANTVEKLAESVDLDFDCYMREGTWLDICIHDDLECLYRGDSFKEATVAIKKYINSTKSISVHAIRKAMTVVQKDLFVVD